MHASSGENKEVEELLLGLAKEDTGTGKTDILTADLKKHMLQQNRKQCFTGSCE